MRRFLFLVFLTLFFTSSSFFIFLNPGSLQITWLGYEVQISLAVFLAFLFLLFLMITFLLYMGRIPFNWFRHGQARKAEGALLEMLSSYEAEIFTDVFYRQKKAPHKLLDHPFLLWISGNAFEKAEKPFEAEKCFMELAKKPSAAFLGFKGQVRAALHRGDFKLAYDLLHYAQKLKPSSPWTLKHLLALARDQKKFKEAEDLILRLENLGYLSSDQSKKQLAYLYYQQALDPEISPSQKESLLRQSHSLDPSLAGATEIFASLLQEKGQTSSALKALEATWALAPTQKLGDLYLKISTPKDDLDAYQAAHAFVKHNPVTQESLLFLARTAYKAKLWGEARAHLSSLLKKKPTSEAYQLLAKLELEEKQDWKAALKCLEEGLKAPRPA